jgi:hypothetical protein
MDDKHKEILNKLAEIIYEQFIKDLNAGYIKNGICSNNKQVVGKSATKSKTFHQPAFKFGR